MNPFEPGKQTGAVDLQLPGCVCDILAETDEYPQCLQQAGAIAGIVVTEHRYGGMVQLFREQIPRRLIQDIRNLVIGKLIIIYFYLVLI